MEVFNPVLHKVMGGGYKGGVDDIIILGNVNHIPRVLGDAHSTPKMMGTYHSTKKHKY